MKQFCNICNKDTLFPEGKCGICEITSGRLREQIKTEIKRKGYRKCKINWEMGSKHVQGSRAKMVNEIKLLSDPEEKALSQKALTEYDLAYRELANEQPDQPDNPNGSLFTLEDCDICGKKTLHNSGGLCLECEIKSDLSKIKIAIKEDFAGAKKNWEVRKTELNQALSTFQNSSNTYDKSAARSLKKLISDIDKLFTEHKQQQDKGKNNNNGLLIGGLVLLLVVAAGVIAYLVYKNNKSKERAWQDN